MERARAARPPDEMWALFAQELARTPGAREEIMKITAPRAHATASVAPDSSQFLKQFVVDQQSIAELK
jgi:acetyl-CoA acetyltransferase